MTENDIKVLRLGGETRTYRSANRNISGSSYTVKPGEPLKDSLTYAHLLATGDPEAGTDIFIGICARESTESATVVGDVDIQTIVGGTVLRGTATTTGNVDTLAEIRAYLLNYVGFDLTSSSGTNGIFTIDENETDDPNKLGLRIIDGDPAKYTLDVLVSLLVTELTGGVVGQTID